MAIFKSEIEKSERAVADAEITLASLNMQHSTAAKELEAATDALEKSAYAVATGSGNAKDHERAKQRHNDANAKLTDLAMAVERAVRELQDARKRLHVAREATEEADALSLSEARMEGVKLVADAIAKLQEGTAKLHASNRAIVARFGSKIMLNHRGTMVSPDEFVTALTVELARVSTPEVGRVDQPPALPGAKSFILGGDPKKATPLIEAMTRANAALVRRLTAKGEPEPVKPKAKPPINVRPPEPDADDAILNPPAAQSGQTFRADQIVMPRRELKV